ncbi:transporter substrate-binding domain-containing protein [Pectobacterium carotovorum subsp. carotovorum]|uniref:transporter substrate-binding domain-containing protein n=1 Tax=Pectobacterium carotovorum TaxID=554 RepID=UPI0023670A90|nr:transporter substrate-binding domain-containing protein [Pectobacterium carotovorum]WDF99773.1 transporter substrate-binding domain-containing protein [Pectobacterium carotovorum subsp. carotovorum]
MSKTMLSSLMTLSGVALTASFIPTIAHADVLEKIADRGVISVCTNVNNPPLAFLESSGETKGLHIDLLNNFTQRLSTQLGKTVKVDLVPVLPANRVQFLQQGKCDILFTSLTVSEERKKLVQFVEPYYYAAGPALLTKKGVTFSNWEEVKGKAICSNQGSSWNVPLEQKFGANIVAFQTQQEVDQSLRDGRCAALVSDDSYLQARFLNDKEGIWKDYIIQNLTPFTEGPWGLAVRFNEPQFTHFISDVIKDWNKQGTIIELAKKWGLKPAPFAVKAHEEAIKL